MIYILIFSFLSNDFLREFFKHYFDFDGYRSIYLCFPVLIYCLFTCKERFVLPSHIIKFTVFVGLAFLPSMFYLGGLKGLYSSINLVLHLILYILLCIWFLKSENNVFLFQKAMVDIGVFVGIVYVLIVFLANYGFELNLLSSKFYYQHGLVRIAFFWNEPLLMGFYFAAISRVAWFNEREVVSNFLLVASIASLSFSGLIFALVSYVSRYRFYEYLSDCKRLASILFIICTVCLVFYSVLGERVSDIVNLQDSSLRIRLAMIVASLNVFMEYPIFGIGWGESGKIIHQYITVFSSAFGNSSPKPQSVWLLMLSEIGLYGVIMFLIGLFYLIENKRSSSFFLLMPAVLFTVSGIAILPMIFVLLALSSVVDIYKESQSV